jgi:hypothetical protein
MFVSERREGELVGSSPMERRFARIKSWVFSADHAQGHFGRAAAGV